MGRRLVVRTARETAPYGDTMKATKPRPWAEMLDLYPGTFASLVEAMGSNRNTVWQLKTGMHRKTPHDLLALLAAVLERGTADGSVAPTREELTAAWLQAFRGKR